MKSLTIFSVAPETHRGSRGRHTPAIERSQYEGTGRQKNTEENMLQRLMIVTNTSVA
jgi:hypothetical protein